MKGSIKYFGLGTALIIVIGWSDYSLAQTKPSNSSAVHSEVVTEFFDDFSGAALDPTFWNVRVSGEVYNNEQQAYVDSSATIYITKNAEGATNGALVIKPVYSPGFKSKDDQKFDFLSGRIDSKAKIEFVYGTASARMKLPAGTGFWPAFWLLGNGKWPDTGEIDVMENVGEADWVSVALHGPGYFGETPLVNKVYMLQSDASNWHIYSVDWTPQSLIFKLDGVMIYRVTRPMVENYGAWAFDNPKYIILNLALGGAYPYKTNGVKSPYNGIPESTVNLIKENKGSVLVDWVRVSKN